jgi:type IV pilus assembly protein PilP
MMKIRENSQKITIALFVLLFMFSAGCKKKEVSVSQPAPQVKNDVQHVAPVQKQHSTAQMTQSVNPSIDFSGRKDPFKAFVVETKSVPVFKRGPGYGLLPIQNYEVGQFRVLGIIAGLKENSALVVDPGGKAYVVKSGMEIGKNGGQIQKISTTSIEVMEQYRDEIGKIRKRTVILTLPRKE